MATYTSVCLFFFLFQTFIGLAIAAFTPFMLIMFHVQPALIEAPISIAFL